MYSHIMNSAGRHQIIFTQDRLSGDVRHRGEWASYQNYASLTVGNRTVIAVTDYFAGGVLEPGRIYQVEEAK